MSMIECINHKEEIIYKEFELQKSIDMIDNIILSMIDAGASNDTINLLMNAREQLYFEKRKAEDEIKKMEVMKG